MYMRVVPRDLFNEAKLLKCVGKLALLIHDRQTDLTMDEFNNEPFDIQQDPGDGSIFVANITFRLPNGQVLPVATPLNCKEPWPLLAMINDEETEVFDNQGNLILDFSEAMPHLSEQD